MARLNDDTQVAAKCQCGHTTVGAAYPVVCAKCQSVVRKPAQWQGIRNYTAEELSEKAALADVKKEEFEQSEFLSTSIATLGLLPGEADPHGIAPHAPGAKLDAGKMLPWLCIAGFSRALAKVAEVTTKGAAKYSPNGWMEVPDGQARYMDAFARHMLALGRGETVDVDTGCVHKAQMIWNLLASMELEIRDGEAK